MGVAKSEVPRRDSPGFAAAADAVNALQKSRETSRMRTLATRPGSRSSGLWRLYRQLTTVPDTGRSVPHLEYEASTDGSSAGFTHARPAPGIHRGSFLVKLLMTYVKGATLLEE